MFHAGSKTQVVVPEGFDPEQRHGLDIELEHKEYDDWHSNNNNQEHVSTKKLTYRFSEVSLNSNIEAFAEREKKEEQLIEAAKDGDLKTIIRLCEVMEVDPDARGFMGWTAAHWASRTGNLDILRYLKDIGANLETLDDKGDTLLHKAAANGQIATTHWLIRNGFNVTAPNNNGMTPVHLAKEHAMLSGSKSASQCAVMLQIEEETSRSLPCVTRVCSLASVQLQFSILNSSQLLLNTCQMSNIRHFQISCEGMTSGYEWATSAEAYLAATSGRRNGYPNACMQYPAPSNPSSAPSPPPPHAPDMMMEIDSQALGQSMHCPNKSTHIEPHLECYVPKRKFTGMDVHNTPNFVKRMRTF